MKYAVKTLYYNELVEIRHNMLLKTAVSFCYYSKFSTERTSLIRGTKCVDCLSEFLQPVAIKKTQAYNALYR